MPLLRSLAQFLSRQTINIEAPTELLAAAGVEYGLFVFRLFDGQLDDQFLAFANDAERKARIAGKKHAGLCSRSKLLAVDRFDDVALAQARSVTRTCGCDGDDQYASTGRSCCCQRNGLYPSRAQRCGQRRLSSGEILHQRIHLKREIQFDGDGDGL